MKIFAEFFKSALVGGLLFLLPIGIILVAFSRIFDFMRRVGDTLQARFFPSAAGDFMPLLITTLLLLLLALVAGTAVRTGPGQRLFRVLETKVLTHVPIYTISKQMLADVSGAASELVGGQESAVVLVELDDMTVFGFLIERGADGTAVVYLPGAPSALSGSVALVAESRITMTTISPREVMSAMRGLGNGLAKLEQKALGKGAVGDIDVTQKSSRAV